MLECGARDNVDYETWCEPRMSQDIAYLATILIPPRTRISPDQDIAHSHAVRSLLNPKVASRRIFSNCARKWSRPEGVIR
jgi:hypothetical protein